jgi:hypothetical protein
VTPVTAPKTEPIGSLLSFLEQNSGKMGLRGRPEQAPADAREWISLFWHEGVVTESCERELTANSSQYTMHEPEGTVEGTHPTARLELSDCQAAAKE